MRFGRRVVATGAFVGSLMLWAHAVPAHAQSATGGPPDRCPALAGTANVGPAPVAIAGSSAFVYKTADGQDLRLHLFRPSNAPRQGLPVVVFFFGGGWMNGVADQFALQAQHVAGRGAAAILVDYRTYCRNAADVGDEVADAADALRWIRGHAGELGIDPAQVAAVGGSAGGHLALSAAMFGGKGARADLLLLFYPCVDLTNETEQQYSAKALAGFGRDLSPLYHIGIGLPPSYIFQGTEDPLYAENKRFCDEAIAAGNRCRWTEYQGAAHGFFNAAAPSRSPFFAEGLAALDAALTREGWLKS